MGGRFSLTGAAVYDKLPRCLGKAKLRTGNIFVHSPSSKEDSFLNVEAHGIESSTVFRLGINQSFYGHYKEGIC
jgi:hypothetical protein